mgnify:FL=1
MNLSPTHPPLAPACSRPIAGARDVPRQTARCPPPRPRGAWKTKQRSSRDRSWAPGCASLRCAPPGAHSLITLRSIESREHSYARKLARRLPALYLATLGQLNRTREIFLSPTHPPLALARSRPSLALGTCPGRQLAAPRPARGGRENKQNP